MTKKIYPPAWEGIFLFLVNDVVFQIGDEFIAVCFVCAFCGQSDRLGKIKAENTHNRFRIDHVSAAGKINVAIELTNEFNEGLNILNSNKLYVNGFHVAYLLSKIKLIKSFYLYFNDTNFLANCQ